MSVRQIHKDQNALLTQIRSGNEQTLERLYDQHRGEFIMWLKKTYGSSEEDAIECYQRAFTAFYYNVKDRKVETLSSTVKTYLFGIGKNVFLKKGRDKFSQSERLDDKEFLGGADPDIMDHYDMEDKREIVRGLLDRIGEPCKTVLSLFYLKHYSVEAIAAAMNYKSERIVSKRKSICLTQMRKMLSL